MGIAGLGTPTVPYIAPIESYIALGDPVEAPELPVEPLSSKEEYIAYIRAHSKHAEDIIKTIDCENREWDTTLQSYHKANGPNGREDSWGLAQIHLPSWKIPREKATDPKFALDFIIEKFDTGEQRLWTCWRLHK